MRRLVPPLVILGIPILFVAVVFHPHRLADWTFLVAIGVVLMVAVAGSSFASWGGMLGWGGGGLHFLPKSRRRTPDRPDEYDYPDSGR